MRTLFLAVMVFMDLSLFAQYPYVVPSIPSGGQVYQIDSTSSPNSVFVGTGNASVNLSSNSYSLQYNGTPRQGTTFVCRFDATKLTANPNNVSIFGLTPLKDFPGQGVYYIAYTVQGTNAVNKTAFSYYTGSMIAPGGNYNTPVIFNQMATYYDSVHFQPTRNPIPTGATVQALNDSGSLGYSSCAPWYICGNTGNPFPSFVGNIDTADLRFEVFNIASGIISAAKGNTALGFEALLNNSNGTSNTAFGSVALQSTTSGATNTGIGGAALSTLTTGSYNTGVGDAAGGVLSSGSFNTFLGYNTQAATSSAHNAVAVGATAVASTNQLTVAGVENAYFPGMNNGLNYMLTDTSGTGNFVPRAAPLLVPIIDSVTGTSAQTFTLSNNQINYLIGSTTIAGATLAFPTAQAGTITAIWGVQTTTTTISGTNTGNVAIPSTVAAGVSRTFVNINGNWK